MCWSTGGPTRLGDALARGGGGRRCGSRHPGLWLENRAGVIGAPETGKTAGRGDLEKDDGQVQVHTGSSIPSFTEWSLNILGLPGTVLGSRSTAVSPGETPAT